MEDMRTSRITIMLKLLCGSFLVCPSFLSLYIDSFCRSRSPHPSLSPHAPTCLVCV